MMVDARFKEGIGLFNEEEFFDAHEIWEDLWQGYREDDRAFLQALIQIAAGFYHVQCQNEKGARSQLSKGLEKLYVYLPVHQTIKSAALYTDVENWLAAYSTEMPDAARVGRYPRIDHTRHSLPS